VCVAACEINVHQTDCLRLDVEIPGEQHIYVRSTTPGERQQWLVALGSAKAQGLVTRGRKTSDSQYSVTPNLHPASSTGDAAKTKKSELRLYCDLLMQQVHSIKEAAKKEGGPDITTLDESTHLLSATCDTFIKTLDECLTIADANPPYRTTTNGNSNNVNLKSSKSIMHSNSE